MNDGLLLQTVPGGYRCLNDPDEVAFLDDVLETCDPELVSFAEGVLTLHTVEGDRDYQWVRDEGRAAYFPRVRF